MELSVLVVSRYFFPGFKGGGPIKSIANLLMYSPEKIGYALIVGDRDLGDVSSYCDVSVGEWNKVGCVPVFYLQPGVKGLMQIANIIKNNNYDIVYINSFFSPMFSFFPLLVSRVFRKKVVLAPRGELSQGALAIKSKKKECFIRIFKWLHLHKGVVFQASSHLEAEDVRRALTLDVDISIAENVGAQEFSGVPTRKDNNVLNAVFVSRISKKKNLLGAIGMLEHVNFPLVYDIYGPKEDLEYWESCQKMIEMLPAHINVNYKGALPPKDVVNVISRYDVFFLPTEGENYGHVIAEALCAGLPLVISDTTPWQDLEDKGLGWDISLTNPRAFSAALNQLAALSSDELHEKRKNILAWAKNRFSQKDAIDANIEMFRYASQKSKAHQ